MGFIFWIIIGAIAGFLAEKIMKADMGLLMNIGLGIVGALVGGFLINSILGIRRRRRPHREHRRRHDWRRSRAVDCQQGPRAFRRLAFMTTTYSAAARSFWAAAFLFLLLVLPLAGCGAADAPERERLAVSAVDVEMLRTEAAARFISTDDALADLETAVSTLDSTGQANARPRLEALRGRRATLQSQLDSLGAASFPTQEAFGSRSTQLRQRLEALDATIARDRILIEPDAGRLREAATGRLERLASRAERIRADSTQASGRTAAALDSTRVRLERTLAQLNRRDAPFDSLRDVLAEAFSQLPRLERDSLTTRLMPDSLR